MAPKTYGNVRTLQIHDASDGDPSRRPRGDWTVVNPPHPYLHKLADAWLQHKGQRPEPNACYYLDRLPHGYTLYQRTRKSSGNTDKHLYGHPGGKFFDSPNRFTPHFLHLMDRGSSVGCPCSVCDRQGSTGLGSESPATANGLPKRASAIAASVSTKEQYKKRPGRPPKHRHPDAISAGQSSKPKPGPARKFPPGLTRTHDEEEVPDTIRWLFDRLKTEKTIDEPIVEPLSMDWRAEQPMLDESLRATSEAPAWVPRLAEIVLFTRKLPGQLTYSPSTNTFEIWSESKNDWVGFPDWEAGIVTQTPEEPLRMEDIIKHTPKAQALNYSGFRIEPLADVNSPDKSLASRSVYVPMHHIRPFVFCNQYLYKVPNQDIDASVWNAKKVISTVSVVDRWRFKGEWPSATVLCKGIYLGSELIVEGDVVRLFRRLDADAQAVESEREKTVVLHVSRVEVHFSDLDKASNNDYDQGHPYQTSIKLSGKAYTLSPDLAYEPDSPPVPTHLLPPPMRDYYGWRLVHPEGKRYGVPFPLVAGRMFEAEPMLLWHPQDQGHVSKVGISQENLKCPSLNIGLDSVREARAYGAKNDSRINEGHSFFWGDHRADALGLISFNNAAISTYDETRDPHEWREAANIMEKVDGAAQRRLDRERHEEAREIAAVPKVPRSGAMGLGLVGADEPLATDYEDDEDVNGEMEGPMASAIYDGLPKIPDSEVEDTDDPGDEPGGQFMMSEQVPEIPDSEEEEDNDNREDEPSKDVVMSDLVSMLLDSDGENHNDFANDLSNQLDTILPSVEPTQTAPPSMQRPSSDPIDISSSSVESDDESDDDQMPPIKQSPVKNLATQRPPGILLPHETPSSEDDSRRPTKKDAAAMLAAFQRSASPRKRTLSTSQRSDSVVEIPPKSTSKSKPYRKSLFTAALKSMKNEDGSIDSTTPKDSKQRKSSSSRATPHNASGSKTPLIRDAFAKIPPPSFQTGHATPGSSKATCKTTPNFSKHATPGSAKTVTPSFRDRAMPGSSKAVTPSSTSATGKLKSAKKSTFKGFGSSGFASVDVDGDISDHDSDVEVLSARCKGKGKMREYPTPVVALDGRAPKRIKKNFE